MQRIPEKELMDDWENAAAYATANFEEAHTQFITHFQSMYPKQGFPHQVLDLGCGPGDISIRFARAYPQCRLTGIEASNPMLQFAQYGIMAAKLTQQIQFQYAYLPNTDLTYQAYDTIISNSLLHHLNNPYDLWSTIKHCAKANAFIFIMDLMRPTSQKQAKQLVLLHAKNENKILQEDFYHSLCAAYEITEIEQQLKTSNLQQLAVKAISDRHFIVYGTIPTKTPLKAQ